MTWKWWFMIGIFQGVSCIVQIPWRNMVFHPGFLILADPHFISENLTCGRKICICPLLEQAEFCRIAVTASEKSLAPYECRLRGVGNRIPISDKSGRLVSSDVWKYAFIGRCTQEVKKQTCGKRRAAWCYISRKLKWNIHQVKDYNHFGKFFLLDLKR